MQQVNLLMKGAIDLHIHSGPGLVERSLDHAQAALEACDAGMRAIVLKDQHIPTADTARIIQKHIVGDKPFHVFGSVVLNNTAGGLNPRVVDASLRCGAKIVWMPTLAAQFHKEEHKKLSEAAKATMPKTRSRLKSDPPLSILDDRGRLVPEVDEICALVAESNAVLGTGHLSMKETRLLVSRAQELGVQKIMLDHPEHLLAASLEEMKDFCRQGVYVEHVITLVYSGKSSFERICEMIRCHGAERCVVVSDLGQKNRPHPVEGMRAFVETALKLGLSEETIRTVTATNPADLLDL